MPSKEELLKNIMIFMTIVILGYWCVMAWWIAFDSHFAFMCLNVFMLCSILMAAIEFIRKSFYKFKVADRAEDANVEAYIKKNLLFRPLVVYLLQAAELIIFAYQGAWSLLAICLVAVVLGNLGKYIQKQRSQA